MMVGNAEKGGEKAKDLPRPCHNGDEGHTKGESTGIGNVQRGN